MHVSILGTGSVGSALARGLSAAGHTVTLGSRRPGTVDAELVRDVGDADPVNLRTAASQGEIVVLAVPGHAAPSLAADLADDLAEKVLVDPTNEYPDATGPESIAERIARAAPAARVVKAFNTIGAEHMTAPVVGGEQASMFICGDDDDALVLVSKLAADLGFDPVVTGHLATAGRLEELARLWIDLAGRDGRDIAFRLLGE